MHRHKYKILIAVVVFSYAAFVAVDTYHRKKPETQIAMAAESFIWHYRDRNLPSYDVNKICKYELESKKDQEVYDIHSRVICEITDEEGVKIYFWLVFDWWGFMLYFDATEEDF